MNSNSSTLTGICALTPEETDVVNAGLSIGKFTIIGGGFGTGSAFSNPMKFPSGFDLVQFQADIARMMEWFAAGMPIPPIDLGTTGTQP